MGKGQEMAKAITDRLRGTSAAEYLGISASTLEKMRHEGRGPRYLKLGGRVFYQVKDLDSYIQRSLVETTDSRVAA